ncbi:lysylphosphatidylglycerol synthase transmembrane domain-containing protein [Hydrocarboniphaga effusa]|jgi:uncharacterized protein (TIRG00374 family)|uniref:lysylphosphatidylglycerol synthase transmembrane domain-containing protein n=1 Tax=Hydrocarboniphaga effusa TaxID=243629 RepID=UPI0035B0071D
MEQRKDRADQAQTTEGTPQAAEQPLQTGRHQKLALLSWLLGLGILAALIGVALHQSEEKAFIRLMQEVRPEWLTLTVLLQAATYCSQGQIWRDLARHAGHRLSLGLALQVSLAKLFVDQTIPLMGIGGTTMMASVLKSRGLSASIVMGGVGVSIVSYFTAYLLALAAAMLIALGTGQIVTPVLMLSGLFTIASIGLIASTWLLVGRAVRLPPALHRLDWLNRSLKSLREADPGLLRKPSVLLRATVLQLSIVALDALTLWALLRSLGVEASPAQVFASFMISSIVRSLSFMPGGIGAFEAASFATLQWTGVSAAAALSATLLFRGLSFWLPMIPGLLCSRSLLTKQTVTAGSDVPRR